MPTGPDIGLVMGGSGTPIPGSGYVTAADNLYIHPNFPNTFYPNPYALGLFTPEGLYPSTGVNSLPLDASLSQGVAILDNAIHSNLAAGIATTVFGYSQSTLISSLEMAQLDPSGAPSSLPVQFVLIGNEVNPNGGALSRFDIPGDSTAVASMGIDFQPATPADSFPTVIYTREYDGFADFPRYPLNLLADLNAEAGILTVHNTYLDLTPEDVASAVLLPGSKDLGADSPTDYYMIPTANLPLLDPLRSVPVVGTPIADLLQPDLRVLVNLGYGGITDGWDPGPANVPTTFGLFPNVDAAAVLSALVAGTQAGLRDFLTDLGAGATLSTAVDPLATLSTASPVTLASLLTGIINGLAAAASTAYGTLLPTADIVNALLTSLPALDIAVFLDNLGNPLDAVGLPIAATTGLVAVGAGLELQVLVDAGHAVASDLAGIIS